MPAIVKTVKLPQMLARVLARTARQRGVTESVLIREGIEMITSSDVGLDMQALIGGDLGAGEGPRDLSHNRKRLAGYGRSRHR